MKSPWVHQRMIGAHKSNRENHSVLPSICVDTKRYNWEGDSSTNQDHRAKRGSHFSISASIITCQSAIKFDRASLKSQRMNEEGKGLVRVSRELSDGRTGIVHLKKDVLFIHPLLRLLGSPDD